MKSTNVFIIILIVILLILCGILGIKMLNDKNTKPTEQSYYSTNNNLSTEDVENNSINLDDKTAELIEEGMNYAEEQSSQAKENINRKDEKEKIQLAVGMAAFGNNSIQELTYDNLDKQLKENLGSGNYTLKGPDSNGNFTVKIDTRIYTIDKNGAVND